MSSRSSSSLFYYSRGPSAFQFLPAPISVLLFGHSSQPPFYCLVIYLFFLHADEEVRIWMESEASSVSGLLSDIEAKRTFILENEEALKRTAGDLRELEELRNYVNPRSLEGGGRQA